MGVTTRRSGREDGNNLPRTDDPTKDTEAFPYQAAIWVGYRALDQDFEGAGGRGLFAMDATYQGPELGVTFTF